MRVKHTLPPCTEQEHWRAVVGFPDYEVSSLGNVRRVAADQSWRVGRSIKPYRRIKDDYRTVGLYRDGKQVTCYLHRVVCEAFHGPQPGEGYEAAHIDGDPGNNAADNLAWKLPVDNSADKRHHGTMLTGVNHAMARIGDADIRRVFELRAAGLTLKQISAAVGIHFTHVSNILKREAWSHVPVPADLLTAAQTVDGRKDGRR